MNKFITVRHSPAARALALAALALAAVPSHAALSVEAVTTEITGVGTTAGLVFAAILGVAVLIWAGRKVVGLLRG